MKSKVVLAFALTLTILVGNLPTHAAFVRAVVVDIVKIRDSAGTVTGIRAVVRMYDDAILHPEPFEYTLTGPEFSALPAGAAAKRAALVAILKRETQTRHAAWIARETAKPQLPLQGDPSTDLGLTEITTFTGAAAPFSTPSPSP